jgi:hypothetical protein
VRQWCPLRSSRTQAHRSICSSRPSPHMHTCNHTHTRARARALAHTHAHTHARADRHTRNTRARAHTHARTHTYTHARTRMRVGSHTHARMLFIHIAPFTTARTVRRGAHRGERVLCRSSVCFLPMPSIRTVAYLHQPTVPRVHRLQRGPKFGRARRRVRCDNCA